jgi:DNA-binding CsgD family transcriptional regulator
MTARGRIAIHTGDARLAKCVASVAEASLPHGSPEVRRHAAWVLAQLDVAAGDLIAARAHLAHVRDDDAAGVLPVLMVDISDHPQLVRIALAAGDEELAQLTVAAADQRQLMNPHVTSIAAAATHARGLLKRDASVLAEAAELLATGPRCLARASALEDLGVAMVRGGNHAQAVVALGTALEIYTKAGATWDASRARRRLRDLGVRRRLVKPTRPTTGWSSLTDAEVAVVELVAQGMTNRVVAERLFISRHTVSMHLRHVFMKLEISSRVQLTRLAFQHGQAA